MRAEEPQPENALAGAPSTGGNGAMRGSDGGDAKLELPPLPPMGSGSIRTPSMSSAIKKVPSPVHRTPVIRYGAAVLFVLIALLITMAARPYVNQIIFVFFWPAVVGAAMVGGLSLIHI